MFFRKGGEGAPKTTAVPCPNAVSVVPVVGHMDGNPQNGDQKGRRAETVVLQKALLRDGHLFGFEQVGGRDPVEIDAAREIGIPELEFVVAGALCAFEENGNFLAKEIEDSEMDVSRPGNGILDKSRGIERVREILLKC